MALRLVGSCIHESSERREEPDAGMRTTHRLPALEPRGGRHRTLQPPCGKTVREHHLAGGTICGWELHPQEKGPGIANWSVITHGSTRETNIKECIYPGCQRQTQEHNTPDTVHTADAVGLTHIPPRGL